MPRSTGGANWTRCWRDDMTRVAVLQMTGGIDPAANAQTIADAIAEATQNGAAMLFTPEMSGLVDRDRDRSAARIVAESDDPVLAAVRAAARRHGIWVQLGSLAVLDDAGSGKRRNRALLIDAQGEVRARYDKLHLFDVDLPTGESWRESAVYGAGDALVVADSPVGALGMTICYDLRFAELYALLGAAGASVFAVPSAFTVPTGAAHWHVLLRARAIECGCFVIAAAQVGAHPDGRTTWGHSLVVDPWGTVLLDMGGDCGLGYVEIDVAMVEARRRQLPVLSHRRDLARLSLRRD